MARFYSFSPVPLNNTPCIIYLKNYPNTPIPAVWKSTKKQFQITANGLLLELAFVWYYTIV